VARGSARAGRDCVALPVSLIPPTGQPLSPSLPSLPPPPPPLTTRSLARSLAPSPPNPCSAGGLLPFRRPTPFCFSLAPRRDGEDGSHRLRSTATPQARLVLLLLYLAETSTGVGTRDSLAIASGSAAPEIQASSNG